jgi:hypothetical protein
VEPDVPLASAIDTKEIGESALESALPWDRIAGVPFKASALPPTTPSVAALATEEDVRAQHDPDYRWLVSDIAALDEVREQKTVWLNLKARREERARFDKERLGARTAAAPPGAAAMQGVGPAGRTTDVVLDMSDSGHGRRGGGAPAGRAAATARSS